MLKPNDVMIWDNMIEERESEVLKEGVYVTFYQAMYDQPSFLEYNFQKNWNFLKFQHIFKSIKYHLDIFNPKSL
jgi:hypothetical protein